MVKQGALDRIRNSTRIMTIMKSSRRLQFALVPVDRHRRCQAPGRSPGADYERMRTAPARNLFELQQLDSNRAGYKQQLANANPAWASQQDDATKVQVAPQALFQLQQALDDPSTPDSPQLGTGRELSGSWNDYPTPQQQIRSGPVRSGHPASGRCHDLDQTARFFLR